MGKARSSTEEKLRYKPMSFDVNKREPEAAEGEYRAVIDVVKLKTNRHQFPMIQINWIIKSTNTKTKAAEKSKGSTVTDFVSFFPDGDRRGNMAKRQFKQLCDLIGIDVNDVLPRKLTGDEEEDFGDLLKALKKKKATIWVTTEVRDGEPRARIHYSEPRGFMAENVEEEEEEEEEEVDKDEDPDEDEDDEEEDDDSDEEEEEEEEEEEDDDEDPEEDEDEDEEDDEPPTKKGKKKGKKKK